MAMEAKASAPIVPQPAVQAAAKVAVIHPSHTHHAKAWQSEMDAAFAAFLQSVNTQLLQAGQLKLRPVVLSYADIPDEECFIACTLVESDPANPDSEKIKKLLTTVEKDGALVFECMEGDDDWRMHYRDGQDQVQSILLNNVQAVQLEEIARSGKLDEGFPIYDPKHLQEIIQLAESFSPDATKAVKKISPSKVATELTQHLSAAGLQVFPNPVGTQVLPRKQIAALKKQLAQYPEAAVVVLCTPAYLALANKSGEWLHKTLLDFGKGKQDNLLPLSCLGGFGVAARTIPNHFLFRDYEPGLRTFDGPQGGMPAFLDMFGDLSGKSGLGLLPDLLDLESTNRGQQAIYAQLFTRLSQTQARLTTDHALEEKLDAQLNTHPLRGHYPETQGLDVAARAGVVEEKHAGVPQVLADFLTNSEAKTALLLAPTLADTELSGLAVVEMLRQQPSRPRVIAIDLSQFPGRTAHQCVVFTLRHVLKLSPPIIRQLQQHTLGDVQPRPTIFILKNYQHTGGGTA